MASKWDDLGVDWEAEELPSGIHRYSGFKAIIDAINEKMKLAKRDPEYLYFDLEELKGKSYGAHGPANIIISGLGQLLRYFVSPNAVQYPANPDSNTRYLYDFIGLPRTLNEYNYSLEEPITFFEEYFGQDFDSIFNDYLTDNTLTEFPPKSLLKDAYTVLKGLKYLKISSDVAEQYSKTLYKTTLEIPNGVDNNAAANAAYASEPIETTITEGSCIVPGIIYYKGHLGNSGDNSWFTAYQDSWPESITNGGSGPSGIRALPSSNTSGRFFFNILDSFGDPIQPPSVYSPVLAFGGSDGLFAATTVRAMGGLGPGPSSGRQSNFGPMPWPRPLWEYNVVTPTISGTAWTYDIFCDPEEEKGLPAVSYFEYGSSKRFTLLRLDVWDPVNLESTANQVALWRAIGTVSVGAPHVGSMVAKMVVDINGEDFIEYYVD